MKKVLMLALPFVTAVLLSACGTSSVSGEVARNIQGKVENYSGLAGTLEAFTGDVAADLGTGTIDGNGSFSFRLDSSVPESALSPFGLGCEGAKISNFSTNFLIVTELNVIWEGGTAGSLILTDVAPNSNLTSSRATVWFYVDQDVSAQGTCEMPSGSGFSRQTADLELKRGWNVVSSDVGVDEASGAFEVSIYSGSAAGTKWFYY